MLSYRHAFHAGNFADVLKHLIQVQLLNYLKQKDKPFYYIDTHAGAGGYELNSKFAAQNAEYKTGISHLWQRDDLPAALQDYVALVKKMNGNAALKLYPGSPWLAQSLLREQDKSFLFELHPSDHEILHSHFPDAKVQMSDGFTALKSLLPPPPRRALVLIDPPYENKEDYQQVSSSLREALKRFPTGTYAVWYPLLQRHEAQNLPERLKKLPAKSWLNTTLTVHAPQSDGFGMHGTGMFILNPPWTLQATLQGILPYLVKHLGQDTRAGFTLEKHEAKVGSE